jgi:UDP-N-acetylglucosamine 1-carboxyvinyltransferase
LASVLAEGTTVITNAAREPEIADLQEFLNRMGAKIMGAGTDEIQIEGVKKLKDVDYNIMPDRIETGTFLCFAVATKGNLILENTNATHITPIINKLEEAGCRIKVEKTRIEIMAPKRIKSIDIKTMPYPGFPTDMQSIFSSMLTTAKGTSIVIENIFENRYKYTQELNRMGAKITVEGKSAIIRGTKRLYGTTVKATDLRGGAALVLAGMMAKGKTEVENVEYILRGYENLDKKLLNIGGNIKLENM